MKHIEYIKIKRNIQRINYNSIINYMTWKKDIRKRDNLTCQRCHNFGNTVHHKVATGTIIKLFNLRTKKSIIKCKLLWDRNNGIILCEDCHKEIDNERTIK